MNTNAPLFTILPSLPAPSISRLAQRPRPALDVEAGALEGVDGLVDLRGGHAREVGGEAAAWMVKRSGIREFGEAWLQRHGLSVGSEALGFSSRVLRAA